jgi:hypothetical protein
MAEITLAKALKVKNRLTGRLAKVQADIQAYNSVPAGQADQVNVPALMQTRAELVGAQVALKTAINDANREAQRDIGSVVSAQSLTSSGTTVGSSRSSAITWKPGTRRSRRMPKRWSGCAGSKLKKTGR